QLLLVRYAVDQTARRSELRRHLAVATPDRRPLEEFLEKTKQEFVRWFTRPGEEPPIINWFVMSPGGTILADSYEDPKSVGGNYPFRDYYAGLFRGDAPKDRTAVYLSRVYESEQDGRYKFSAVTRVLDGERVLGLLGASIAIDVQLVALDMRREPAGAMLVAPMDRTRRPGQSLDAALPSYVVALQRDYARPGQKPDTVGVDKLAALEAFAHDPALKQSADRFNNRGGFVHYARVGESHFVVLVEQLYPWPVSTVLQRPLACGLALVLAVV